MRGVLLFLAQREGFKTFAMRFAFFRKLAWRFVAGETLGDAVRVVRETNQQRISGTLDFLGENTLSRQDAENAASEIELILDRIHQENIDCNVSIKLTQLGLALDTEFCYRNLVRIVRHARRLSIFVRVDMEDSRYTDRTLDLVLRVHNELENIGTVIQAYLYRSMKDIERLLAGSVKIRLCKGAYLESDSVAFKRKEDTDANFVRLMEILLQNELCHALATHDEAIITAAIEYGERYNIPRERFEFQMLYGVRRDLQVRLAHRGYRVRIYIPYGQRWYPYFMRRLAERPANLFFIARNLFRT